MAWSRLSKRDLLELLWVPLGFLLSYAVVVLWLGFDVFEAIRRAAKANADFNASVGRGHAQYLVQNLREFFVHAGVASSLVTLAVFARSLVALASSRDWKRLGRLFRSASATLALGLVAVLVTLEAAGFSRGETARLWIFVACFFPFLVADVCARGPRWLFSVVLACTLAQAILVTNVFATSYPTFFYILGTRLPTWDGAFLVDGYVVAFVAVAAAAAIAERSWPRWRSRLRTVVR
jgi:hypothetical protein